MSQVRTYEEAVTLCVKWWSDKAFNTPLNQNNGDNSSAGFMAFALMNMMSDKAKEDITQEKISKFESKLTELLTSNKGKPIFYSELDVDYHPNDLLAEACDYAGINSGCLPCKTFTRINPDHSIEGRYQYGGKFFTL